MTLANMSPIVPDSTLRAERIEGWMSRAELLWLAERAAECRMIVEIGVWKGRSTMALCDACPGKVYAIDHFRGGRDQIECRQMAADEDLYRVAITNLSEHIADGSLILIAMDSRDAAAMLQNEVSGVVDMVFIDGGHDYGIVSQDISNYRGLVKPGGIIAGHDFPEPGIQQAIAEAFSEGVDNPVASIWATTV